MNTELKSRLTAHNTSYQHSTYHVNEIRSDQIQRAVKNKKRQKNKKT